MFSEGDLIVYEGEGVCRVKAVGRSEIKYMDQSRTYYTLSPVYHTGVIYVPTDAPVLMRPMLTKQEAMTLIKSIPDMPNDFERGVAAKQAAAEYKSYLQTYDCTNLLQLVRMLYTKREEAAVAGRGYGQTDDRYFKRAKELLYGELALALEIPVGEVENEICNTIGGADQLA